MREKSLMNFNLQKADQMSWQMGLINGTNVGKDAGEKGTLIHCWWEGKVVQSLWKTLWRLLEKLEVDLPI
jgi:hypothetical protein